MRWTSILAALALFAAPARAAPDLAASDLAAMTAGELLAFTQAMPKGGELHNHLGGAVFGETALAWAVADGDCVDVAALSIVEPCTPKGDLKPAAEVAADPDLRSALLDSLSTRHPGFRDRSGHDQFFSTFDRTGPSGAHVGDAVAMVMDTLALQNTFYLEVMVTPQGRDLRELAGKVAWRDDLPAMKAALTRAGIDRLVSASVTETDAFEAQAREDLKCGTPAARPGCQVTVRYLFQAIRTAPPQAVFAQLQLGAALVAADRRWVGLQLVAPEDDPLALAGYSLHMRMVDYLTGHGRVTPVALHAGELSLEVAPPEALNDHVAQAVRVAGARRIGHGTDLPHGSAPRPWPPQWPPTACWSR
jgi:adenosine deaminase